MVTFPMKYILILSLFLAQTLYAQTADEMKQQLEQEIKQKYDSSANGLLEYEAYKAAYLKWLELKRTGVTVTAKDSYSPISGQLRDEALIMIVDFTKKEQKKGYIYLILVLMHVL
jgi:hypothetical protein